MKKQETKKKRNQKLKRKLASMTAIVLVLAVGVWGTMAYLSTLTDKKTNTFTGSGGILLKLTETNWDAYKNGTTVLNQEELNTLRGDNTGKVETQGEYLAKKYTPGMTIPKNPVLTNNSTDADSPEWVALAVSYTIGNKAVSYTQLKYLIEEITFNTTTAEDGYWIAVDPLTSGTLNEKKGYMIYIYSKVLAKDAATKPLFTSITIKSSDDLEGGTTDGYVTKLNTSLDITADDQKYKINGNLPAFQIDVIGAAIKNEYKKSSNTANDAEQWSDLSTGDNSDQTELKNNLVNLLKSKLDENTKNVGNSSGTP